MVAPDFSSLDYYAMNGYTNGFSLCVFADCLDIRSSLRWKDASGMRCGQAERC